MLLGILLGGWNLLYAASPYSHLEEVAAHSVAFLSYKILHHDKITYCVQIPPHHNSRLQPRNT